MLINLYELIYLPEKFIEDKFSLELILTTIIHSGSFNEFIVKISNIKVFNFISYLCLTCIYALC